MARKKPRPIRITIRDIARKLLVADVDALACIRRVASQIDARTLLAIADQAETVTDQSKRFLAFRLLARSHISPDAWERVLGPLPLDEELVFVDRKPTTAHQNRDVDPGLRRLMRQKPR